MRILVNISFALTNASQVLSNKLKSRQVSYVTNYTTYTLDAKVNKFNQSRTNALSSTKSYDCVKG